MFRGFGSTESGPVVRQNILVVEECSQGYSPHEEEKQHKDGTGNH